jgi:hypothetical protein
MDFDVPKITIKGMKLKIKQAIPTETQSIRCKLCRNL